MTTTPDPVGTLDVALAHTARLLDGQPELAAEQAREVLYAKAEATVPVHAHRYLRAGPAGDASAG